jgi:hypothetical protein
VLCVGGAEYRLIITSWSLQTVQFSVLFVRVHESVTVPKGVVDQRVPVTFSHVTSRSMSWSSLVLYVRTRCWSKVRDRWRKDSSAGFCNFIIKELEFGLVCVVDRNMVSVDDRQSLLVWLKFSKGQGSRDKGQGQGARDKGQGQGEWDKG